MATVEEVIIRQTLWTPENGERDFVVRPDWRVEYGGIILPEYAPIETVAISALAIGINRPQKRKNLLDNVSEIEQRAGFIGVTLPETLANAGNIPKPVLSTLMSRKGLLGIHLYRLGKPPFQADVLVSRAGDEQYFEEMLERHFVEIPTDRNLSPSYRASFAQKFRTDWGFRSMKAGEVANMIDESQDTFENESVIGPSHNVKSKNDDTSQTEQDQLRGLPIFLTKPGFSLKSEQVGLARAQVDKLEQVIKNIFGPSFESQELLGQASSVTNSVLFLSIYEANGNTISLRHICDATYNDYGKVYSKEIFERIFLSDVAEFIRIHKSNGVNSAVGKKINLLQDPTQTDPLARMLFRYVR